MKEIKILFCWWEFGCIFILINVALLYGNLGRQYSYLEENLEGILNVKVFQSVYHSKKIRDVPFVQEISGKKGI